MAGRRTSNRSVSANDGRANSRQSTYVYGSAVKKAEIRPGTQEQKRAKPPQKKLSHTARKNRDRARYMNFAYVFFLTMAMGVTGFVLIGYIWIQSSITTSVKRISSLESQLNNLVQENNEALGRIENAIDLEEIRRIAITELGMTYAGEGQIVEIPESGSDYVRQYSSIHK